MDYREIDKLVQDVSSAYVKAHGLDIGNAMAVGFLTANMGFLLARRDDSDIRDRVIERCKEKIAELLIEAMAGDGDAKL